MRWPSAFLLIVVQFFHFYTLSGRLVKVQVDLANNALIVQGTTTSIVIWVVLFLIKQVFHFLSKGGATGVLIDLIGSNILFLTACSLVSCQAANQARIRPVFLVRISLQRRATCSQTTSRLPRAIRFKGSEGALMA